MRSFRLLAIVSALAAVIWCDASSASATPITIAGETYDTVNFADTLISSGSTGGSFTLGGGVATLAAAVTGTSVDDWAFCNCTTSFVQLGFTDNVVVNGLGADLAFFEIGTPDNFGISLTVGGPTQTIVSASTGFTQAQGFGINLATIDLSTLGVASGASVPSIVVNMGVPFANTSLGPTLAAVTALGPAPGPAPVPEPATLSLLGLGLAGASLLRRYRNK